MAVVANKRRRKTESIKYPCISVWSTGELETWISFLSGYFSNHNLARQVYAIRQKFTIYSRVPRHSRETAMHAIAPRDTQCRQRKSHRWVARSIRGGDV